MSTDGFAYQASEPFAAAVLARAQEIATFNFEVVNEVNARLHPNEPLWSGGGMSLASDGRCVGFNDANPDEPPPAGLSRARNRRELHPKPGKSGQVWRDEMTALNRRPLLGPVFREHGVETFVMDLDRGRAHHPAMRLDDETGQVWFSWAKAPVESQHLIPRRLSEFHAFAEAMDERRAVSR